MQSRWSGLVWTDLEEIRAGRAAVILPVGAVEAHGPHLPLETDGIIAGEMAEVAVARLCDRGWAAYVLPALDYSAAPFAQAFPGTISIRPETVTALIEDVAGALADQGVAVLGIANAHLDPAHLAALHTAERSIAERAEIAVAFPDLTRKPWALRLTDEFKSGACHAGRFEASIVLAARPDLVREDVRTGLEPNPVSIARAIREGRQTFEQAGGPRAYFGDPAAATAEEGRQTIDILGGILAESMLKLLELQDAEGSR